MVLLMAIVPLYLLIGEIVATGDVHAPEVSWDRLVPLRPEWGIVYGSLYLALIILPVFIVRDERQIRRTFFTYLIVWLTAYACFLVYPTVAPRPPQVAGSGFVVWGLRFLYSSDPPYNCFPSLHVAHSFVSALACHRVHRGVGVGAGLCAVLVGLSTLFTKQHYILDVIAGIGLAYLAYLLLLHRFPRESVPALDRRAAPVIALGVFGFVASLLVGSSVIYEILR